MKALNGLGVALVTPFTEKGRVDGTAIHRLVAHCIEGGVDYLVVLGTTGESVTLNEEEKASVIQEVIEANKGRLPLVIGIGGNNTRALVHTLQHSDFSAFEAILSVSPYYNKPTQDGIFKHYQALAHASPKPIILYNVPSRTGSNMIPETVIKLAYSCPNIIGIKEASGDMDQVKRIIKGKPSGFLVISGDDATSLDTILAGGNGVISVLGQGVPKPFSKMVHAGLQGEREEAKTIEKRLLPGMELIFEEGNPAGIKELLHQLGLCNTYVRLPLVSASKQLGDKLSGFLEAESAVDTL